MHGTAPEAVAGGTEREQTASKTRPMSDERQKKDLMMFHHNKIARYLSRRRDVDAEVRAGYMHVAMALKTGR